MTTTKLTEGFSSTVGTWIWEKRTHECHERYEEVAYGEAYLTTPFPETGSILVFNNTDDQLGSFTLGKRTPICGFPGFSTEFDSMTLFFPSGYTTKLPMGKATASNIALADSIGTAFNYMQVVYNEKLNEFVKTLKMSQCQQNKKDLEVRKLFFKL